MSQKLGRGFGRDDDVPARELERHGTSGVGDQGAVCAETLIAEEADEGEEPAVAEEPQRAGGGFRDAQARLSDSSGISVRQSNR